MMYTRAARTYKKVDLGSASKAQILDRLYERFLRDCDQAASAIESGKIAERAAAIDHAVRIVTELVAALDHAVAPELCANLAGLYDFATDRLTSGNTRAEVEPIMEARSVMEGLRDAFREASCANG